ncbi:MULTISPECIES: hypothetical protein [unclassified Mesorhizobium]|uniref:hypothetical protein n=1 Tax=unclassified Mesorhizobium TaxID=325217 RepID=UPI00117C83CE|nr:MULTISPECIES: hypothetical protein [unclassified Mesorhizobium]
MDSATLFYLPIEDWQRLASLCFSPAVGIGAIYLFGVDLATLPFMPAEIPYRPPVQFVRAAALFLSFLFTLSLSAWLTLRLYAGPLPDVEAFKHQFFRDLSTEEAKWLQQANNIGVNGGQISLVRYDGYSDVRVFVNNVRIFGTHADCVFYRQCGPNSLPYRFSFTTKPGSENHIEIFVDNSGVSSCNVSIDVELNTANGDHLSKPFSTTSSNHDYLRYETVLENISYRTCDQIQLVLKPGSSHAS